ncbi:hypothetical protein, partial [Klebsiella pneumoniae]|uniref:hypothetical protein n=2 Tax=Pseudomonadota TaxID=1224 RepID=UPI0019547E4C
VIRSYSAGKLYIVAASFAIFVALISYNTMIGAFGFRDWVYVTLPFGAILATAMVAQVVDGLGLERVVRIAVWGSLINLAVM